MDGQASDACTSEKEIPNNTKPDRRGSVVELIDTDSDASGLSNVNQVKPSISNNKRSSAVIEAIEVHGSESEDKDAQTNFKRQRVIAHTSDYTTRIRQQRAAAQLLMLRHQRNRNNSTSESESMDDYVDSDDEHDQYSCSDMDENDCDDFTGDCDVIPAASGVVRTFTGYFNAPADGVIDIDDSDELKLKLNADLLTNETIAQIKTHWSANSALQMDNFDMIIDPFKVCTIMDFVENARFLNEVRESMTRLKWHLRSLDFFEFFQTNDLTKVDNSCLSQVHLFLKDDVMPWVSRVTGLELETVSVSCSCYTFTDYLLVHDDLQEDRCVAFILYLTESDDMEWTEDFGGSLQLFEADAAGHPKRVSREIYPRNNQFIFFPVSNKSHHQVGAIKTMNHARLSINGWFHMKNTPKYEALVYTLPETGIFGTSTSGPIDVDVSVVEKYVGSLYLDLSVSEGIQRYFEDQSQSSLEKYFVEQAYNDIARQLTSEDIRWEWAGPPNRRWYQIADEETLPCDVKEFLSLFKSDKMFDILSRHTGLELNHDNHSTVRYELQKWTEGCYSLMSEANWFTEKELDLIIYFGTTPTSTPTPCGEMLFYDRSSDSLQQNALIDVAAKDNTLNLIYREEHTARIVRYIPPRSINRQFYVLVCSYKE